MWQVTYEYLDDNNAHAGYRLHFHFAENEFFTNKTITKTSFLQLILFFSVFY